MPVSVHSGRHTGRGGTTVPSQSQPIKGTSMSVDHMSNRRPAVSQLGGSDYGTRNTQLPLTVRLTHPASMGLAYAHSHAPVTPLLPEHVRPPQPVSPMLSSFSFLPLHNDANTIHRAAIDAVFNTDRSLTSDRALAMAQGTPIWEHQSTYQHQHFQEHISPHQQRTHGHRWDPSHNEYSVGVHTVGPHQ